MTASATPRLPDVDSMSRISDMSTPEFSAACTRPRAGLILIDPPGLKPSTLRKNRWRSARPATRRKRSSGIRSYTWLAINVTSDCGGILGKISGGSSGRGARVAARDQRPADTGVDVLQGRDGELGSAAGTD